MNVCKDKRHHATEREALDHLRWAKKQPGGKGLRDLCVYQCVCGSWCVGRAWRGLKERQAAQPDVAPASKPRTFGEIRRKLARLERQWDRHRQYQAAQVAKLVEADRMLWETEEELRQLQYQVMAELGIPAV